MYDKLDTLVSKSVTRYTDGGPEGWMQSPTGEFVRFKDYERARIKFHTIADGYQQERDEARTEIERLKRLNDGNYKLYREARAELNDWHQKFCGCAGGIEDHKSFSGRSQRMPVRASSEGVPSRDQTLASTDLGSQQEPSPAVADPGPMPPWGRLLLECRDALPAIDLASARLNNIDLTLADRIEKMLEPWRVRDGEQPRHVHISGICAPGCPACAAKGSPT